MDVIAVLGERKGVLAFLWMVSARALIERKERRAATRHFQLFGNCSRWWWLVVGGWTRVLRGTKYGKGDQPGQCCVTASPLRIVGPSDKEYHSWASLKRVDI
ncbi:hypothetical protein K440DRAFT_639876 [Wilcoxina mikolae CBS 423.85]|nr:hypothetical protein K440DRAFT_639876 [Wilcoxina mikolae CBS 423.85]